MNEIGGSGNDDQIETDKNQSGSEEQHDENQNTEAGKKEKHDKDDHMTFANGKETLKFDDFMGVIKDSCEDPNQAENFLILAFSMFDR